MATFNAGAIEATLDLDIDPFQRGLRVAREEARKFAAEKYEAQIGVDTAHASGQLATLRAELERLATSSYSPKIDLDGGAYVLAGLAAIEAHLERVARTSASPRVELDGGARVTAEIAALKAELAALGATRVTANVNADTSGLTSGLGAASSGMSGLMMLAVGLAPALVPGLAAAAAAAGGLASALAAAGGAGGAMVAAIVGNVTQVLGAQKNLEQSTAAVQAAADAATAAQQASAAATRGVQAAEQNLANARRNAAQSTAAAEMQVAAAQRNVQYAQEALNQARQAAIDKLQAYRDQLKGAQLDEEGAELAVRRAWQTLQQALADPNATKLDRDEARQAYQEALFNMHQVRKSRDDLQKQAKKDREAGVKGDAGVIAARRRLADARRAEAAAEQALANARRNGAQQVAAAQQAVADAQQRAENAARANAEAQAKLQQAQADQAKNLATVGTPAAQGFTAALTDLKGAWHDFLDATAGPALGVAADTLELIAKYLPALAPVANAAAGAVSDLIDRLDRWLQSGGMHGITTFLIDNGPKMIRLFGGILGNLAEWFGGVADAFAPFAADMMRGLEDITGGWADWAQRLEKNPAFQHFIDYVMENGPLFLDVLGSLWHVLVHIGKALSPAGVLLLKGLRWALDGIASVDPMTLSAIALGIGAIMLATGVGEAAGVVLVLMGLGTLLADVIEKGGPASGILKTLGGMVGDFWDVMKDVGHWMATAGHKIWVDMQPEMQQLADVLRKDLAPAWHDFWKAAGPSIKWLIEHLTPAAARGIELVVITIADIAVGLAAVLRFLTGAFTHDWGKSWRELKNAPGDTSEWVKTKVGDALGWVSDKFVGFGEYVNGKWDDFWTGVGQRTSEAKDWLLDHLTRGPDSLLGRLQSGFRDGIDAIGRIWDDMKADAGKPVKFVVDYIYNEGIRRVINSLPGVDGTLDPIDTSSWSFAEGGVLPGWTPGRDVHRFVSPTGGVLNLSGGEGILIPQATAAIGGAAGIKAINDAARQGRLNMGAFLEQSHATGGIVYVDGEKMTPVAAAQLAVAEHSSGIPMRVIQGSYQPPTSYSGTSHTGGGVMDTWPGSFAAQAALRRLAFAAWARNIPGAHYAGSGAHVHSVSLIDPTAAGNAQALAYKIGQDGLGGSDYGPRPTPDLRLVHQALALAGSVGSTSANIGGITDTSSGSSGNPMTRFLDAVDAAKDFAKEFPGWISKLSDMGGWADVMVDAARSLGRTAAQYVNDKIPNRLLPDNPIPTGIFDQGGWLQPGQLAMNLGSTPEPVLTDDQWRALSSLALGRGSAGGGLSKADVDRIVAAIEDNRSVHVEAPTQATGHEIVELLAYELRK